MSILKNIGPGLLYAGAAIGVSHLVQSTSAGAQYGYLFIVFVIIAHFFKYPFFAISQRYTSHYGENLIDGLRKVGSWAVWLIFIVNLLTMFLVQSAVTLVTAGLASSLFGDFLTLTGWIGIILLSCVGLIFLGGQAGLNKIIKPIIVLLAITTFTAFVISFFKLNQGSIPFSVNTFDLTQKSDLDFFLSFLGWMPAPIDIVIWQSIWIIGYRKVNQKQKEASKVDFNIGYFGTAIMAILFVILGANVLGTQQIEVESSAIAFAKQLAQVYTENLGSWSYYIILIAAFTTMFSTSLTCFDALTQMSSKCASSLHLKSNLTKESFWHIALAVGTFFILLYLQQNMRSVVKIATVSSFIVTPILAYCFIRLNRISDKILWNKKERYIANIGLFLLIFFTVVYLWNLVFY
jgi:Mn2+/Fe2+ NRAMP family transporter